MKLYYTKGACSLVCRIVINELGYKSEYEAVDLATKKTETGENFLNINPKGSVPALALDNGEILTENAVILQYLADSSMDNELLPAMDNFNRYRVLEWLNYVATEMHKGLGLFFNPKITEAMREEIFIPLMNKKLNYLNQHLEDNHYLHGDQFTLPDAYLFVMLTWAVHFKFNLKEWKNILRYFNELKKRKSIETSLKQEKLEAMLSPS